MKISTSVSSVISLFKSFRTPNEGSETASPAGAMRLSASVCTANIAGVKDGEWALIAPYGDHLSPDETYTQIFQRPQADNVVKTWNSLTGGAARLFKNLVHGLGAKSSCPIWDGHPETDKKRWPKEKLLAEVTNLRVSDQGLEGCITWNAKTANSRPPGPLYPSPLWWHWPKSGNPPVVFPELLESIGLVATPNISAVPAWTQNSQFNLSDQSDLSDESDQSDNETKKTANIMLKNKVIAALGLAADATDEQIDAALKGSATTANALTTANAARDQSLTDLSTANAALEVANGKVTTLTGEVGTLTTANAALTTEKETLKQSNGTLAKGVLDVAEKVGKITPAERAGFETKITANAAGAITEIVERKQAMNTRQIEINGNRVDITTANARRDALETAVAKRMESDKCDRDTAFGRVQTDPNFKALFDAMQDPTKPAAV